MMSNLHVNNELREYEDVNFFMNITDVITAVIVTALMTLKSIIFKIY